MQLANLIMIGPQGAGKGTQSGLLAEKYGYQIIGLGKILRDHVNKRDILGKKIQRLLERGELVNDAIIEEIIREKLESIPLDQPLIIDGFPRTLNQAHLLQRLFLVKDRPQPQALYLNLPRSVILARLAHRRECNDCGTIFKFLPKLFKPLICPKCGGPISGRSDDRPEVVEARLNIFFSQTFSVIDYYKKLDRLIEIDAAGTIEEVAAQIEHALRLPHRETPHVESN